MLFFELLCYKCNLQRSQKPFEKPSTNKHTHNYISSTDDFPKSATAQFNLIFYDAISYEVNKCKTCEQNCFP